jgi:hypothetical protein
MAETSVYQFLFLAPVPKGHGVLVAQLRQHGGDEAWVVLDRTASTLYCDETLWRSLLRCDDVLHAVQDPLAVFAGHNWVPMTEVSGICGGAIMATTSGGDSNFAKTYLLVEPGPAPFR